MRERAELLLRKAAQDEFTLLKLVPDPQSPDEVIGFHAQQAVEKMVKAVLTFRSISYRPTHDLVELIDLLRDHGVTCPEALEESRLLTPFATTLRYDDISLGEEQPFDRAWIMKCVGNVREWAESAIRKGTA